MAAEARGSGLGVVIAMPILTPRADLQRAEPPEVLTGIDALRQSWFEMEQAVHKALHVQAIEHSNGAKPEKSGPAEKEVTEAK